MRLYRYGLFAILCSLPLYPQNSPTTATASPQTADATSNPTVDPRFLLLRALQAAGGQAKIAAVMDFVAHGTITVGGSQSGQVTIKGKGDDQFRMDSDLNGETNSWAVSKGSGQYKTAHNEKIGAIPSYNTANTEWLTLPYMRIASALRDPNVELKYLGPESINGTSFHQVKVIRHLPKDVDPHDSLSSLRTATYYLNATDFTVSRMDDSVHPNRAAIGLDAYGHVSILSIPRTLTFSDFRAIDGILVPFSVSEDAGHQRLWAFQLDDINFNSGQSDGDFVLR